MLAQVSDVPSRDKAGDFGGKADSGANQYASTQSIGKSNLFLILLIR
jgi:hypothetical protein